jgi:asparagine synthase (glutamine-hydrolysing)
MCGIIGAWGEPASVRVREASALQAHRGPDDSGHFLDVQAQVALSHVRLSIQDLSPLGHQPMFSEDRSVVLVYNGEIYNFRELRAELEADGVHFRGHSDTEVLLALYLREGAAMLSRLNGIFAFAIWDQHKQEMLVARDALGVKPFYYAELPAGFAFASEIKALLPLLGPDRVLDPDALHRYMSFLWCPGEGTPLKTVRKLLPGEAMVLRAGRIVRQWQWFRLPVFEPVLGEMDEASAIGGTVAALRTAVQRQLVADVPVGAFLSGGLDSSAIVAMACEQTRDIRCFTIESSGGAEEGYTDDLPYARRVASHLGVPLDVVHIDSAQMASDLERMVYQLDEPLADPATLNVLYISQLARDSGIKVLLSGAGGDDLFTGYRRHMALGYERLWSGFPAGMLRMAEKLTSGLDQRYPLFRRLGKLFSGAGLRGDARLANYFVWTKDSHLRSLYSPEFKASLGAQVATQPMLDFLAPLPESKPALERMLALEQRFFLADHNLIYTDKMSMAAGVEVRVPFLDLDLLAFAACIPPCFKQRGTVSKWVLKRAMEPYLPRDVIYRPKTGFGAPLRRWMRHELREMLGAVLSADSLRRRGIFEPTAVQRLIQQNDTGEVDAGYTLLSLLCIEIWCRRFVDMEK